MGILDDYPAGYPDSPVAAELVPGGGLLADPAPTGFGRTAPFGGLLSDPAADAARAPGALVGTGGGPMDWRSLLMSAGAGLLKSGGRIEGLGEGVLAGLRMSQSSRGHREIDRLRALQWQKQQKDMAQAARLDAAWEAMFRPIEGTPEPVTAPADPPDAPQTTELPHTPGFSSTMPSQLHDDLDPVGTGLHGTVAEPGVPDGQPSGGPRYHPFVAGLSADERDVLHGMGRRRGEQWLLRRLDPLRTRTGQG